MFLLAPFQTFLDKITTETHKEARTETPFNPIDGHRNFFRCASMDHR